MTGGGIAGGGMAGMPGLGGALGGGSSGLAGASSAINTGLMLLALVRRMESREGPSWSSAFPAPGGEAEPIARFRAGSEFDGIVRQAAERFRLPEKLIHAVVKAESAYNPRAKSPAGAMGLMQLMPGTANALGVRDPWDPRANVMGGSLYLRQMIDRYGGDVRRALAAYNWGPGNVDKHGLTRLPDETRGYLARIGGLLREFR
ncbi:lytic transglycosylase domain-containing protein [bacterium]|nr:lytic transglycosylase domain-containing protein [bacterium]